MTLIKPLPDEGRTQEILRSADDQFRRATLLFEDLIRKIEAGEDLKRAELKDGIGDLQRSVHLLIEARNKLDHDSRQKAGIVHDYAVDFDDARDQVRSVLDRLRAAQGARDLP